LQLNKRIVIGICLFFMILPMCFADAAQRRRKVLVLHSYHQGLEWSDNITRGIQEEFKPYNQKYEIYYEYLDSKRNAGDDYFAKLYQLQKAKHQNEVFEILLVSDNNALDFAIKHGRELYGDVPMVFCGINDFSPTLLAGRTNVTGIVENTDFEGTIQLIRKLHPDRRHITVIVDRTPSGMAVRNSITPVFARFPDLRFDIYQDFLLSEVRETLGGLGPQDAIYLLTFNRDREGNYISYTEGIEMVHSATSVPIYGSWDFYMGKGLIGGIITRGIDQGRGAARMALAILDGPSPSTIPIEYSSPTVPMFDYKEMMRFHLSVDQLPTDAIIINAPPTWAERNAKNLVVLLGVLLAIALSMGLRLLIVRRRANRMQEMANALEEKVIQRTRQLEAEKAKLNETLSQIKTLHGLLPICAACKKIRDDQGYWNQIEIYIAEHTDAVFSHSICPECQRKLYPDLE
jgi:ABC-type uncharacterized transport system substrate-binding protein